jgi:hypothetical protein
VRGRELEYQSLKQVLKDILDGDSNYDNDDRAQEVVHHVWRELGADLSEGREVSSRGGALGNPRGTKHGTPIRNGEAPPSPSGHLIALTIWQGQTYCRSSLLLSLLT